MLSVSQETIELEKHLPDKKKKQIKDKEDLKIKINEVLSAAFCSMLYTILYIPAPKSSKESVLRSHFISKRLCAFGFALQRAFRLLYIEGESKSRKAKAGVFSTNAAVGSWNTLLAIIIATGTYACRYSQRDFSNGWNYHEEIRQQFKGNMAVPFLSKVN